MPQQKLNIVPVKLLPENKNSSSKSSTMSHSSGRCTIKIANVKISFSNGVDEHIIQTIMRELKHW